MPPKNTRNFLLVLYVLGTMGTCPLGLNHAGPTWPLKSPSSPILNIRQNVCSLFVIEKSHFVHKAYMSRVGLFFLSFFQFFDIKNWWIFPQKISRISQILTRKNSNFFGWETDKILSLKKITVYEVSTSFKNPTSLFLFLTLHKHGHWLQLNLYIYIYIP